MTTYTKQHNWTLKDTNKDDILGADFDAEFTAIKAAVNTNLMWRYEGVTPDASGNLLVFMPGTNGYQVEQWLTVSAFQDLIDSPPVGHIMLWPSAASSIPPGYEALDGRQYDYGANPQYTDLWILVGANWQAAYGGTGTQFNSPNYAAINPPGAVYYLRAV